MDYSIKIGGEAGQGVQTIGHSLSLAFSRMGYHVFTYQDYESRIRGGHNIYQIRVSDRPVMSAKSQIDIIVALDKISIELYEKDLHPHGQIIYDASSLKTTYEGAKFLNIPFVELALQAGKDKLMANTVATGAVLGMLAMELETLFGIIKDTFYKKGDEIVRANKNSAIAGYDYAVKQCLRCSFSSPQAGKAKMLISGNEAIGLGAIASGCKFYSAYPMTPATSIMLYIASKAKEYDIIVEQAEDEIAAINMAVGASYAGLRAMTGTSGGGFALMVEGLSLAAMAETPLVIALAQRPGPATGLPTKTMQADLLFALYTAHGEFPRVIFAPGSPEECFYLTNKAFDLAEKYQIPVLILTEQYLADSQWTYDGFDTSKLIYKDYRLRGKEFANLSDYKRYAFTETGVSLMAVPGDAKHLVVTDSDEHDEDGHLTEDAELAVKMLQKRLFRKLPLIRQEIAPPKVFGYDDAEIVLVGWGATFGVIKEVAEELSKSHKICFLHFSEVYPLPLREKFDYLKLLQEAKLTINIELNATSQFAYIFKAETGFGFDKFINKYDGRPFIFEQLLKELQSVIG